jgi:hypothetical protein
MADDKGRPRTQSTGIIPGQFQGSRPEEYARQLLGRNPTEAPANPPINFPSDLWPQTNVILLESCRKFPRQIQTLELCRHITSEMTPLFCEAVKANRMGGFPASGSRRKVHDVAHGRWRGRLLRRTRPSTWCREALENRLVPDITLCLAHNH